MREGGTGYERLSDEVPPGYTRYSSQMGQTEEYRPPTEYPEFLRPGPGYIPQEDDSNPFGSVQGAVRQGPYPGSTLAQGTAGQSSSGYSHRSPDLTPSGIAASRPTTFPSRAEYYQALASNNPFRDTTQYQPQAGQIQAGQFQAGQFQAGQFPPVGSDPAGPSTFTRQGQSTSSSLMQAAFGAPYLTQNTPASTNDMGQGFQMIDTVMAGQEPLRNPLPAVPATMFTMSPTVPAVSATAIAVSEARAAASARAAAQQQGQPQEPRQHQG